MKNSIGPGPAIQPEGAVEDSDREEGMPPVRGSECVPGFPGESQACHTITLSPRAWTSDRRVTACGMRPRTWRTTGAPPRDRMAIHRSWGPFAAGIIACAGL